MDPQLLYLEDPFLLDFDAVVRQALSLADEKTGIILNRTYFYPTGGGQEHDTGYIGEARVLDVYKEGNEPVLIHVVDRTLPPGPVIAHIDPDRRLRNMQHHTAQHLLSQCFVDLFQLETVSANINGDTPSTIDLPVATLSRHDLDQIEDLANRIIYENREVKSYFVAPEDLHQIPLRRPPKVSENIRIVEIADFDYSACGGTHCTTTGNIGLLKILKVERQNEKTRVSFAAGLQALHIFREYQEIVTGLAGQMSIHPQDIAPTIQRQVEQLKLAQKELQVLKFASLALEARALAEGGEFMGAYRVVQAAFEGRPAVEMRALADEFKKMAGTIAVLAAYDGQKISVFVTCSEGAGADAREILRQLLTPLNGRGGGDVKIAQGGGPTTKNQFDTFTAQTKGIIGPLLLKI